MLEAGCTRDEAPLRIGVLAVQGSFDLHVDALERSGVVPVKIRYAHELNGLDGLIIPGGESTVMTGVSQELGLFEALREAGERGLPVFGTCAGAILLGRGHEAPERLGLVPAQVERNAYGRQLESFEGEIRLLPFEAPFRALFIRAPKIKLPPRHEELGLRVLGWEGNNPVLVSYRHYLLATFHPELTADIRVHQHFVDEIIRGKRGRDALGVD